MFVNHDLAEKFSTRCSQTGVLIFINKSPIHWYRKRQATVEASTFGEEFCAMKAGVDMVESLCYKLQMFGLPVDGSANVLCDKEDFYKNTITPESILKNNNHYIAYDRFREEVAANTIRVSNQVTENNISDLFTKIIAASRRWF